ncbi:MAG TPA: PAS domain S-box protein, partial [Gemmatimonadaceae bacterium]|nr:PAS domain S-box protein [Gemmatimonadaceae bacterium]
EMTGLRARALVAGWDERRHAARATLRRTGAFAGMLTLVRRDGTAFEAELSATTFRDDEGTERGYVFVRDVTERRTAEQALLASEHRYRSLVETTGSVLVGIAPDGTVIEWNREAERLFGYARREVLGRDYFALIADEGRREAMRHEVRRVLAGDTPRPREDPIVSRTGDAGTVLWTVTRLLDMHARPLGVIASGQDITERKRLEAQMQHAQKLESLGVLAGGIAHDFNNLLVGILGNASLALMDVDPQSELHELLHDIETAALRAADLTRQMLAYSGRGRFVVKPLDLSTLVQEMAHLLQTAISKRALLAFDFAPDVPPVEADATQLRQVVMNLITNASDALGGENGAITLRTGVRWCDRATLHSPYLDYDLDEGAYAFVEVRDTGMGMTPETLQRIFDPFFSTKFTGRGLGLAATLGIVRGHRGTITVDSTPGEGTTFRVYFPVAATATTAATGDDAGERPADGALHASGLALLVDDDPTVCDVARSMLERHGFRVVVAHDGCAGLEAYRRERDGVRLALVDLTMPRMGGEEVVAAIRAHDSALPIVLMSGFSDSEVAGRFVPGFVTACIQKPFRVEELAATLRTAIAAGQTG